MSLGIPYMSSKRKLAGDILHFIRSRHPGMTDFYDLFGGGGSVSFTAVKDYRFNVHYNELNSHIYHLVNYLKNNKTLEPKFYEWVTREMFFEQISRADADWYSGYVMSCWSFGNKQSSYMYGSDIDFIKKLIHEIIVSDNIDSLKEFNEIYQIEIPKSLFNVKNVNLRRIKLQSILCGIYKETKRVDLDNIGARKNVIIDNLGRLQNLEYIQNLPNLPNLQITNASYENVLINSKYPVIYCDRPYKGTASYKENGFDFDKFDNWFANIPYAAYLSEYDAPFEAVDSFTHRSSLSATNNKKKTVEKIFWNGKGNPFKSQLF